MRLTLAFLLFMACSVNEAGLAPTPDAGADSHVPCGGCTDNGVCVVAEGREVCAKPCTQATDCNFGCCFPVGGSALSVCAPPDYCVAQ